jgi:hypothetical protein
MRKVLLGVASLLALVVVAVAAASPTVTLASPGDTPFSTCNDADHASLQQQLGSVLYPGSEVEPRSARFGAHLVGEYQQDRWSDGGARGLVASISSNGGSSWSRVTVPKLTKCSGGIFDRASDPWVSFAPNGDLYAISLSFDVFDPHNAILVSKSTDYGASWNDPVAVADDMTAGLDKESITADPSNSSYVYAAWDRIVTPGGSTRASDSGIFNSRSYKAQTFFARSTDGGAHWETPQQIFVDSSFSGSIGSIVRAAGDGTLVDGLVTYGSADWKGGKCASISVLRSTDRGLTWTAKPIIVSPLSCTYLGAHNPDTGAPIRSGDLPDFATDGGKVYAVWGDALSTEPTIGRVFFSQSNDGGLTWSAPITIGHTPPDVDAFTPTIAVNTNHAIGVSFYDFRNNVPGGIASTDLWLTTCASSCSNTASWSADDIRVTPSSFDIGAAPVARGEFLGDYMGMTTNGSTFEPFFIQSQNVSGNPADAFFATAP